MPILLETIWYLHQSSVSIPSLLHSIALIEVHCPPRRYKFRLLGETMSNYHGKNFKGRWIDEAFPHFGETTTPADFDKVVDGREMNYRRGLPLMTYQKNFIEMERLFLPFTDGGSSVDIILAYTEFHGADWY